MCPVHLRATKVSKIEQIGNWKGLIILSWSWNSLEQFPMVDLNKGDWRAIAEQASAEENPAKMMLLVEQLCAELDREADLNPVAYSERMNWGLCVGTLWTVDSISGLGRQGTRRNKINGTCDRNESSPQSENTDTWYSRQTIGIAYLCRITVFPRGRN
jgi:hypothetical protein